MDSLRKSPDPRGYPHSQDSSSVTEKKEIVDTKIKLPQNKTKVGVQASPVLQSNWSQEKSEEFIQIWTNIGQESVKGPVPT